MVAFFLLFLLEFTANTQATKPKSVNLALETVLQFDKDNIAADVRFLDNVQQFLDKLRNVIHVNNTRRRSTDNNNIKFTDFIKSVLDILKIFDDDDLEATMAVFDDEIRKYHYRGCKFYELVEDHNVRRFVANKLEEIKDKPADKLRQNLDNAIEFIDGAKFSGAKTEFLDYVNSLYRKESADKLTEFLDKLQTYSSKSKRANLNLIKVVRGGIRSIIFDHYSKLNANARRDLKIKLETNWRNIKYPDKIQRNIWTVQYTNSFFDFTNSKDFKDIRKTTTTTRASKSEESQSKDDVSKRKNKRSKIENEGTKEVYFYKDKYHKSENSDDGSATQDNLSASESVEITIKPYKHKSKKQYTQIKKTPKYIKPKKERPKNLQLSTFITLYPDKITIDDQKRYKIKATTKQNKVSTLWEENIKYNTDKVTTDGKLKRSNSKINLRAFSNKPQVISNSETIINVNKAVVAKDISLEKNREVSRKNSHWTKTTQASYKPTSRKKYRKHNIPKSTSEDVRHGISIESFEITRRLLVPNKANKTNKVNVLRRINQLERQLEEYKVKINRGTTIETDTPSLPTETIATETEKITSTTIITTKDDDDTTITTQDDTTQDNDNAVTTEYNVTIATTEAIERDTINNSIDIATENENVTYMATELQSTTDSMKNISQEPNENYLDVPTNANIIDDLDDDIDSIMKKYNVSLETTPTALNINQYMEESQPKPEKENAVKGIIEKDLMKMFQDETTPASPSTTADPFKDLNAVLDLADK